MTYSGDKNDPYKRVQDADDNFDGIPDYLQQEQQPPEADYPVITSSTADTETGDYGTQNGSAPDPDPMDLAGVEPDEEDRLIARENRLDTPSEESGNRSVARSPLPRTALVAGGLGIFVLVALLITMIFGGGGNPTAEETEGQEATPEDAFSSTDEYKSQLALVDQDAARQAQSQPTPPTEPQPEAEPEAESEPEPETSSTPQTVRSSAPPPTPRPTPQEPTPASAPPPPAAAPPPAPEPIDPFERWNTLAQAGTQGNQFALVTPIEEFEPAPAATGNADAAMERIQVTPNPTANSAQTPLPSGAQQAPAAGFPVAVIGDNPVGGQPNQAATPAQSPQSVVPAQPVQSVTPTPPLPAVKSTEATATEVAVPPQTLPDSQATENTTPQGRSTGAQGIVERRPASDIEAQESPAITNTQVLQVPLGTTITARLAVPIVASQDGETLGRFAVELTEDLTNPQGQVALPEGTLLITDVLGIDNDSLAIQQTVVALVYPNRQGQIVQETITPNTLIIRSSDGGALIASREGTGGGRNVFTDILTVGGASALAEVGSTLNESDVFTSTASSSDGDETETTTTTVRDNDDPNIFGAVLEGFFGSTADILQEEAETSRDEGDNAPEPILTVEQGAELQVFVNGFLTVRR